MSSDWDRCPLCGSRRIAEKTGDISVQTENGGVRIPHIEYHECKQCGERFFDYEASKTVDEYCLRKCALEKR